MKIAFIVNNFPVLSQTFILNQITGLIENKNELDIYAIPSDESKVHSDVNKYNLMKRTYYFHTPSSNRVVRLLKSISLTLEKSYKYPILFDWLINGFQYTKEAALPIWMLPYVATPFLPKKPYDIIHCHFGPNGLKGVLLKKMGLTKGKLVTSFHGYDITQYIQNLSKNRYKPLFDIGDLFLPISEHWKQKLIELGCNEKKIIVHRMGVDCNKFSFTPRHPSQDGQIRIVTIARLVEKKGVEYAIRAVAKLGKANENIEYNILGDGPLRENLQQLIQELGVGSTVKLLGWKQQHEVVEILNNSHIMLAPSVTSKNGDQEGIPVVLMEAMAMGIPVVSTLHSGIPELVQDKITGFLVAERDIEALAERLNYLIEHPELWAEMGQAGRKQVEENYDINKLNDRLVNLYQELLTSK
ncbi:colanic acid biosynthesis glycosyltransferase WcaL [Hassallia byssoidea VB512170]|uniref:Colanic acid biosynthesis glycosyltransferase WcaL n=1 Tax=Hassallia byssoidea VB512170 TaxID=1304833 RepID=A0A846HKV0_9CYAN|nr:glycosyltransferase [Hassalia byssoidea]NEU76751.1 colanic acid biosynthesis glycosyltransferase WcaL [Hassalia byssoidea VB512170]